MAAPARTTTTHEALMRAMGSTKGFDPMPPDQYLSYQDKRYPLKIRFWAWLCAHTIRLGHRSPWAVGRKGQELHIEHAAADLDVDVANLREARRELEAEHR